MKDNKEKTMTTKELEQVRDTLDWLAINFGYGQPWTTGDRKSYETAIRTINRQIEIVKMAPDPYAEAKAAYVDGELQTSVGHEWEDWLPSYGQPSFGAPAAHYRRKPAAPSEATPCP